MEIRDLAVAASTPRFGQVWRHVRGRPGPYRRRRGIGRFRRTRVDFRRPARPGLEDVSRFPHLFAELVRRGFSERDLEKMSSRNMLRVLRRVEAVGRSLRRTRPPAIGRVEDFRD